MDSSGEQGSAITDKQPFVELLVAGPLDGAGLYAAYLSILGDAALAQCGPGELDSPGRGIEDNGSRARLRHSGPPEHSAQAEAHWQGSRTRMNATG